MKLSSTSYLLEIFVFAIHANSIYLILPTPWPHIPPLPDSIVLKIAWVIVFTIGTVVLILSWFSLGTKTSLGQAKERLVTTGLYRLSRNPQLVAYGIILSSFIIIFFSWLTVFWFLLYIVASRFMVKSEEEFLERKYGQDYKAYCNAVPRIF